MIKRKATVRLFAAVILLLATVQTATADVKNFTVKADIVTSDLNGAGVGFNINEEITGVITVDRSGNSMSDYLNKILNAALTTSQGSLSAAPLTGAPNVITIKNNDAMPAPADSILISANFPLDTPTVAEPFTVDSFSTLLVDGQATALGNTNLDGLDPSTGFLDTGDTATLSLNGRTLNGMGQIVNWGATANITSITVTAVPEPSTFAAMGAIVFFAGLFSLRRRLIAKMRPQRVVK